MLSPGIIMPSYPSLTSLLYKSLGVSPSLIFGNWSSAIRGLVKLIYASITLLP